MPNVKNVYIVESSEDNYVSDIQAVTSVRRIAVSAVLRCVQHQATLGRHYKQVDPDEWRAGLDYIRITKHPLIGNAAELAKHFSK